MFYITNNRKNNELGNFDPFREIEEMEKHFFGMPYLNGELYPSNALNQFFGDKQLTEFKTDIKDEGDSYVLEADLPGFKKEDIKVDINNNVMTLSAERHSEHEEKDKRGKYVRCERTYGSYTRQFDLTGINAENVAAKYDNGVLTLKLPKKNPELPASRTLTIE